MKKTRENLFVAATLLLCVLLFLEHFTGEIWQVVFGVLLVVLMAGHLCRQMVKLRYQKRSVRVADEVLLGALVVLLVTGMLLHPLQGMLGIKLVHKLAAIVFVLGTIGHIVQHRKNGGTKNVS